jgi:SAM-dependent methyltransferase/protein-tyrosine-phosphatase
MAEGFARASGRWEARSAGTQPNPRGVDPRAVAVMKEVGVDISGGIPKSIESFAGCAFDLVITVCDGARESCPAFPGAARTIHRSFDDPPRLAADAGSDDQALTHYRRVRDEIRGFVATLSAFVIQRKEAPVTKPTQSSRECCGPDCCPPASTPASPSAEDVRDKVREGYAKIADAGSWSAAQSAAPAATGCCGGGSGGGCCGPSSFTPEDLAQAIGYAQGDLSAVPDGANMGLSCGNPTALASLRPGEVVLDLGSGGGFDCFVAGPKVGRNGKVIGVDMTPAMVTKARRNLTAYAAQTGLENVEFRLGEIENIPVADNSVDVVISNCVLNLSPDQPRVWCEIARVLKPGGRVAVSDLVLLKPLPPQVRVDVEALVGCVAGASLASLVENMARKAGLRDVRVERKPGYVDSMVDWQDPLYKRIIASLGPRERIADFVTSANITAAKA